MHVPSRMASCATLGPLASREPRRHRVYHGLFDRSVGHAGGCQISKISMWNWHFLPIHVVSPRGVGRLGQKNLTTAGTNSSAWRLARLGVIPFGHTKGFRVMAGSGRSKDVGPGSVWGFRREAAERALVSLGRFQRSACAHPRSFRLGATPRLTGSIGRFPSATFLPYESKIADASSCGHDGATAVVTSCRLSRPVGFPGGVHATEQ